jgi:hypothetical protein
LHCKRCSAAKETATIHEDCFNLYIMRTKHRLDRLRRLWTLSLARYPWPGSPALLLPSAPSVAVINRANNHASNTYNLHMLGGLPQEIITIIWGYLSQNDLLRLSCVLETIDFLDYTNHHTTLLVPLRQVHSWHRGQDPIISTTVPPSSIKMTIDSKGIKSIQRSGYSAGESHSPFNVYSTIGVNHNLKIKFQVSKACVLRNHIHAN